MRKWINFCIKLVSSDVNKKGIAEISSSRRWHEGHYQLKN
jgi:hypothetical protein